MSKTLQSPWLDKIKEKLASRADSEHEQAALRLIVAGIVFCYLLGKFSGQATPDGAGRLIWWIACGFLGYSLALIVWILVDPRKHPMRRLLGAVADHSATSYFMIVIGEAGAVLYGVYLFVTFGNGFRYGKAYLFFSQGLGIAGFSLVLALTDFWREHPTPGIGLLISLVVLPLYVSTLLTRITEARQRAEEANQAKSRFLAVMSHEMRTPLNGIIGINSILATTKLNDEQQDLVWTMNNSSKVLLSLIENVLDISKIEAGKLTTETIDFDLHGLVNSAIKISMPQAQSKGLRLNVRMSPKVTYLLRGDPHHLRQVLINLIGNAVKFTEHGEVAVNVNLVNEDPKTVQLRFEVVDTGIGISAEAQTRIFDSFTQADQSTTRRYGGSGLGTTISKQLVELMGGSIGVSSQQGKGSTFWFELPFAKQQMGVERDFFHIGSSLALLVSNSDTDADVIGSYLASWGVRFERAQNIEAAAAILGHTGGQSGPEFDVILVDQRVVEKDERGAISRLRAAVSVNKRMAFALFNTQFSTYTDEELVACGYSALLADSCNKTLLFNALHAAATLDEQTTANGDVISLNTKYVEQARTKSKIKILVAEDNPTNQKVICKILERAGHQVQLVENGEQALDALEENKFDLAIVDMHMPIMGGVEVVKFYRFIDRKLPRMPFVMLTANATPDAMEECNQVGIDAFLTKPVETQLLLATIGKLTGAERGETEIAFGMSPSSMSVDNGRLLNPEALRELEELGGGNAFLTSLVNGFLRDSEQLIKEMQSALDNHELEKFKDLAHGLKGSVGSIGASALYEMSSNILSFSHLDIQNRSSAIMAELRVLFEQTKQALLQHLERARAAAV